VRDWLVELVQTSKGRLKMPKGIVWTAVISAVAGAGCLTFAFLDNNTLANGFGFVSVASALLASREK